MEEISPLSFRDPAGTVFVKGNRIFRQLTEEGITTWDALKTSPFFKTYVEKGWVIPTWDTSQQTKPTLEHERIPFFSYPYEWPFVYLKEAALLCLEMLLDLLSQGFILKDATPFNFQFKSGKPILIDVLSIEKKASGDPWAGYHQFCEGFLNPLLLASYKRIPHQEWLRGSPSGISSRHLSSLMNGLTVLKKGIFTHVKMKAYFEERFGGVANLTRDDIQAAQFPTLGIIKNIQKLQSLIKGLTYRPARKSTWENYEDASSYAADALNKKKHFVAEMLSQWKGALAWDVGCNEGSYSILASKYFGQVVSMDRDDQIINNLVVKLRQAPLGNILPLVMDWANPTPGMGWANQELKSIFERQKPDVVLYLAFLHHMAVQSNVPLSLQIDLLSKTTSNLIIEFIDPTDAMFKQLMRNQKKDLSGYNAKAFENLLQKNFKIVKQEPLNSTRTIYAAVKNTNE